MTEKFQ